MTFVMNFRKHGRIALLLSLSLTGIASAQESPQPVPEEPAEAPVAGEGEAPVEEPAEAPVAGQAEAPVEGQAEAPVADVETPPADAPPPEAEVEPERDPAMEEAVSRFRQGLALARAGNCEGAIAELQASVRIVERPNTLFNIARCQEELFRYDLAVAAYERYMAIAPADAPDREAVQATMRQLRNLLGTIVIRSNVPAAVWIGDRQVGEAPGEVLVPGGRHAVELSLIHI